ncbi:immunity protein YezG family protein [Saccharophagus degradans]|uniref:DUF600 domain-containing protein n=1 Tax=Saccharophagus degradans (strain 2-40 / ATCC 43961 / DSM 17024) TaxID=203122 RepID=Q21NY1_SACD2|nr:immunity protein YezG family protein [Saccharophagus degradans]ABD79598.1 hypothetical protein Sde_0334 [Saccharophagus degradans 2-40]
MFNSTAEIYQYIAECIVRAIPDPEWEKAEFLVSYSQRGALSEWGDYYKKSELAGQFDIDDGADTAFAEIFDATKSLFNLMKTQVNATPFNKYKFTLNNDGTFDIEFKYDEDFAYMKSLDADSNEFDELLDLDVTDLIESWEGLPQDHPRPWLQQ